METPQLTAPQKRVLRKQVFDDEHPATLLRDFRMLLDFVGTDGVAAAGKHQLLPPDILGELDQRLSRPLHLTLKRLQLQSHPYLCGLHLLFRATGLARVEGSGTKGRLLVDAATRASFDTLNPTEQYFTLLEAWLRLSRPEMIGERRGGFGLPALYDCVQAWAALPPEGRTFELKNTARQFIPGLYRNMHHVALMDLFGLWKVVHAPVAPAPWMPAGLEHTPFGDALFSVFSGMLTGRIPDRALLVEAAESEGPVFGRWQPLFGPYFPAWQNNLVVGGEAAVTDGVYVFKIALRKAWRRIALASDATLADLANWILHSVDFDEDHLYEFTYRDRFGATITAHHTGMDEPPWADEITLGELPLRPGQAMMFHFDFGDNWLFDVKLERIEPAGQLEAPQILETHGKAPEQYRSYEE